MPKFLTAALPWLIVAALAFVVLGRCGGDLPPIPKELLDRIERYEADSARVRAERDSALASARRDSTRAAIAEREASAARQRATALAGQAARAGRLADSAAAAGEWRAAYDARTAERDTLLVVVATQGQAMDSLDSALQSERARGLTLIEAEARARQRLADSEDLNRRLRDAAENAGRCRIARYIPCPTRTGSALVGLGAGITIMVAAN